MGNHHFYDESQNQMPEPPRPIKPYYYVNPLQLINSQQAFAILYYMSDVKKLPPEVFHRARRKLDIPPGAPDPTDTQYLAVLMRAFFDYCWPTTWQDPDAFRPLISQEREDFIKGQAPEW